MTLPLPQDLKQRSPTERHLWNVLSESGPVGAERLAELAATPKGTVTQRLPRLEQAGYVQSIPHPSKPNALVYEATHPHES